jgi:AraC-like DNA-binding protein/tetratricopeptide (TPR) repeat protein
MDYFCNAIRTYEKSGKVTAMTSKLKIFAFVVLFGTCNQSSAQIKDSDGFQAQYDRAEQLIEKTCDSLKTLLNQMSSNEHLLDIQRAKLDLLRFRFQMLDDIFTLAADYEELSFDTIANPGNLMERAQNLVVQSRPDEGIPLILKFLEDVAIQSDSAVYAKIYLAEAYRQKQEHDKGIGIIYEILRNPNISVANRAFAFNRMAALQNENQVFAGSKTDSVSKYSRLCIDISQKHNLTEYLALSQNELGSYYLRQKMPDSALFFYSEAVKNFLSLNKYPQAINTYLNLSRLYLSAGQTEESRDILLKALELGNIEENRNLFMYVYYNLANISFRSGNCADAYEYLHISYGLMSRFFVDRMQRQINEMSAKYDLREKETKIKEEAQKNRTYRLQLKYFGVISLIIIILLIVLVVMSRLKNRAYKKLVEQNLKAIKKEKQVEQCLRNLTENDIMNRVDLTDRHAELALRLEKFMAEEKPYLWSDVGLEEFCKKLNTNRTYLSNLINDKFNMGFYDFLFEYRVKSALEYLSNDQFSHLSVEGIGDITGFKSSSTFYKRFKSAVGLTPHQFRERVQKLNKPSLG